MCICKRPNIDPKALGALEAYGTEMTQILLMNWFGFDREEILKVNGVEARRGEIQDWLNWKARKAARLVQANFVIAIIATFAAIAAAIFSFPAFWSRS
jgi:hypothetical protein